MATWPVEYDRDRWTPCEENLLKLKMSIRDAEGWEHKVINCPICGRRIAEVSTEKSGIIQLKCHNCGGEYPFNLAYYRRQKKRGYRMKFTIPVYKAEE